MSETPNNSGKKWTLEAERLIYIGDEPYIVISDATIYGFRKPPKFKDDALSWLTRQALKAEEANTASACQTPPDLVVKAIALE